ncbi:hypothetical protein ACFLTH_13725 [Bacteroidota bacterium]
MSKLNFILCLIIISFIPMKSICQNRHNQDRFYKAWELIQEENYDQAIILLKKNIAETPNASDIDYDYGWGTLCLAKLCRLDEMVQFYEVVRMKYYGASRSGGALRDWDDKLMEAKESILSCPDKNLDLIIDKLNNLDKNSKKVYETKLEELIQLGSMGNPEALEDLRYQGAALVEFIANGKLILNKNVDISDNSISQNDVSVPSIRKRDSVASVFLPFAMQTALENFDPDFKMWTLSDYNSLLLSWYPYSDKNLPFVALGDFNGDLIQDAILHGHNKTATMIICILSAKSKYKVLTLSKNIISNWSESSHSEIYITHVGPGLINSAFEDKPLYLKTDAFAIGYFEKASTLYYYKDGGFLEYTTSD